MYKARYLNSIDARDQKRDNYRKEKTFRNEKTPLEKTHERDPTLGRRGDCPGVNPDS